MSDFTSSRIAVSKARLVPTLLRSSIGQTSPLTKIRAIQRSAALSKPCVPDFFPHWVNFFISDVLYIFIFFGFVLYQKKSASRRSYFEPCLAVPLRKDCCLPCVKKRPNETN